MSNRKDTPAPFIQRADANAGSRTVTTTTTTSFSQHALPQTPQNKPRMKRASKQQRGHETSIDHNARGAVDEVKRHQRFSHDLNLTDNPRHSVVDNMLMSLNPDQPTNFSPPKDRPPFSSGSESSLSPKMAQSRLLHSSSTNSDYMFPTDASPDRHSYQFGKGRRSTSSSNIPSALPRIDSVHAQWEGADSGKSKGVSIRRAGGTTTRGRGHARKSSKGSGSSSMDFGHATKYAITMSPNALARRSASFDHGYTRRGTHSASSSGTHPILPYSNLQSMLYNDVEAAPMPTVPAGPRRGDQSPVFPPPLVHSTPSAPFMQRRNSIKSSKSAPLKKGKEDPLQKDTTLPASNGFLGSRRSSKQVLPTASHMKSRNPSPTRHVSDHTAQAKQYPTAPSKETARERPGFFRRVFGSSKGSAPAEPLSSHDLNLQKKDGGKANSGNVQTPVNRLYKPPAMEDLTQAHPESVVPPLVKKPSSFFRRRKKSVSENVPTPLFPPHLQTGLRNVPQDPAQHSPTSSLRKVMNPYLENTRSPPRTAQTVKLPSTTSNTSISPQAIPAHPRPSTEPIIRDPDSKSEAREPNRGCRDLPTPRIDTSKTKRFLNPNSIATKATDISFLSDDSSETRTPETKDNIDSLHEGLPRALTSFPTDLPPRSTSKNPFGKSGQSHKGTSGTPNYPPWRDSDVPLPGHHVSSTVIKNENRTRITDAQMESAQRQQPSSRPMASIDTTKSTPAKSEEDLCKADKETTLPVESIKVSPSSEVFYSATSSVHPLTNETHPREPKMDDRTQQPSVDIELSSPTDEDRRQASLLFDGDETITSKSMAAAWLGEPGPERALVRKAYMELFSWQDLNILAALRDLCGRLYLKGESQQVDRILDAFSMRWCSCNPLHGFKACDVVHTICYSVLLLNTDLHQAEIETKMTRTQFLRNIMPTIRRVVIDAAPDGFANPRASTIPTARCWDQRPEILPKSPTFHETSERKRSFEGQRPLYRLSQRPSDQTVYTTNPPPTSLDHDTNGECGPLVKTPFYGKLSTWETQIEIVLKDFYHSVRQQPLPLFGTESKQTALEAPPSANSISAVTSNFLRRTPSMLSKAGSENQSYSRGRPSDNRLGTGRWQSKTRSRPRLYPTSTVASSRRSSFDEQSSITSPSVTSAWSRFSSLGKTQTTMSTDSFASSYPQPEYQQSIGFANALSQAIIREEGTGGDEESLRAAPLLEDESLELHGAPWVKEGILKHKHHLESVDKKAKDRNWVESFCVIEKGHMRLFSFSMNAKSLRQKAKSQRATGGVVGGGNWADNAELLGSFVLRQTLASELPEPGYSKARPHVWALSLPTGAVHLFQVGTPDIVKEFVATANYWSARLSKEPLVGGVSNIEYGWSDSVINAALIYPVDNMSSTASTTGARPSLQSSIRSTRSSIDQGSYRPKLPGDKILINDWTPPPQSMVASALMEVDQLKALTNYVKNIEEELQKHNELRGAVLLAVSHSVSNRGLQC